MAANYTREDIPVGRAHAISRHELGRKWRCDDRAVRAHIAELRAAPVVDGLAILSSASSPKGYWRSGDPDELTAFINENCARARSTFVAVRSAKALLEQLNHGGQLDMSAFFGL